MPNPNKIIEGLEFIDYSSNMSNSWGGMKFPESIAADYLGGSHALFFSGRDYAGRWLDPTTFGNGGFGPRGCSGSFEFVTPIYGLNGSPSYAYISGDIVRYTSGAYDNVAGVDGQTTLYESGITRYMPFDFYYAGHDANTPLLRSKFGLALGTARINPYIASTGQGVTRTEVFRSDISITSITTISTLDLLCEGPIEGLVTGTYIYDLAGKKAGDIGYTSVNTQSFFTGENNLITTPILGTNAPEARSIFWNDTPIVNEKGFVNFQYINYKYNYGESNLHTVHNPKVLLYEDRFHWDGYPVDQYEFPIPIQISKQINEKIRGASIYEGVVSGIYFPYRYYVYNTDLEAIRLNFRIDSLFFNPISGSNASEVEMQTVILNFFLYRIFKDGTTAFASMERLSKGDPYLFSAESVRIQGKITSPTIHHFTFHLRSHTDNGYFFEVQPNQIGWMIRVDKVTSEQYGSYQKNTMYLESITQILSDRFTFPNTACVWSKYDARYFSDVPERSYRARLLKVKVPVNYDPIAKTYNGGWNGTFKLAWTDNPAWCYYDLITNNRYGLGKYIDTALVDKWTLYEVSKYCDTLVPDGHGGLEPRFTCNVLINSKEEAYKVLDDMASIFNGITYYSAGQIFVSQDAPKDPIYLFNNTNVLEGEFTYSDSSKRLRRSVALIRYNDATNNFKPALEYVEDRDSLQKFGIREAEVTAFGCTRPNQARRLGKWFLRSENLETETVEFKVGLEGLFLKPGDVVEVFDQNRRNNIYGGRTLTLTTGYAVLDLPASKMYTLTGAQANNNIIFSVLTPTYTLERGTADGDYYITGFDVSSDSISGLNSSFFRKSQIQNIEIYNPRQYISSGFGSYPNNIKIDFPTPLSTSGTYLPQNAVWTIETTGYNLPINARSQVNNPSNILYPGYYLESLLDKPKPYRIVNIQEIENKVYSITALEYVAQKYLDIDTGASLISVPTKIPTPSAPLIGLDIIYRDSAESYVNGSNVVYTTYQANGINSIGYYIKPPADSGNVSRYIVFETSGASFANIPPYESDLLDIKTNEGLGRSGVAYVPSYGGGIGIVLLPEYFTPLYRGTYTVGVYAENELGERSPFSQATITLAQQASIPQTKYDDYNIL